MSDYIDRGVAIARLTALEVTNKLATMADARRLLADMPASDVAPVVWIPVTEQLPEVDATRAGYEKKTVIATNGKFVRPMIYERATVRGKCVRRWKWIWDRIYDGSPVTHWMPLPEPPKMDGGAENAAD